MPGPAVGIRLRISYLGQRPVRCPPLIRGGGLVHRGADQRILRNCTRAPNSTSSAASAGAAASGPIPCTPAARHSRATSARRLGRRGEQELTGAARKRLTLPAEDVLDVVRQRPGSGKDEAACQLAGGQYARPLQECQRVAVCLGDDTILH